MASKIILVTGCAGFIGFHVAKRLLSEGWKVVGLDNLNDYYDVGLKEARLELLQKWPSFDFVSGALEDQTAIEQLFSAHRVDAVIHLAAQAGVRYSLENPHAYIQSNIVGFMNLLEACRLHGIGHLIYASSSSVYGANTEMPYSVHQNVDHPISLYAATKKSNELMAHTYSHLFGIPATGLRFFTVYGPWGRPDMAYYSFTKAILAGEPIKVFNHGRMKRDFTYIDDIVEGVVRLLDRLPQTVPPYKIYNIGNNRPVELLTFISVLEEKLRRKAVMELAPLQPGDVIETYADIEELVRDVGFAPKTTIEEGLGKFVEWYREYHKL